MKKHSYKYVKQYFKKQGCELLEKDYINAHVKMEYKCSCGNISEINFNKFKMGSRCKKCSGKEKSNFKDVKQYFRDHGCELLEKEYINTKTKMRYKCNCGNTSEIIFNSFKRGCRCKKCAKNESFTFEYVKQYFKEQNCELLEKTYINNYTKMKYICQCGEKSKICFSKFKIGRKCKKCGIKKHTQTMMRKYGVPYFPHCGYSKESQKLFDAIYILLNNKYKNKTYYATLNKEFGINYKDKWFSYDYVNSKLKKAIEYNGSVFHPQPNQNDNEIGWFALDKNKTVGYARKYEKEKYEGLEKRGYQILTVWDYEMKKDFNAIVKKCLDFLVV